MPQPPRCRLLKLSCSPQPLVSSNIFHVAFPAHHPAISKHRCLPPIGNMRFRRRLECMQGNERFLTQCRIAAQLAVCRLYACGGAKDPTRDSSQYFLNASPGLLLRTTKTQHSSPVNSTPTCARSVAAASVAAFSATLARSASSIRCSSSAAASPAATSACKRSNRRSSVTAQKFVAGHTRDAAIVNCRAKPRVTSVQVHDVWTTTAPAVAVLKRYVKVRGCYAAVM